MNNNITRLAVPTILAVVFLFTTAASTAQNSSEDRRISGSIVDPSGAPLPRTLVEVRDLQGKVVAATQTNSRGEYCLELPPGKFILTATLAGFAPLRDKTLEIPGVEPPVNLTLQISSPQEQVVVTATRTETPLTQVGSSVSVISGEQLLMKGITSVSDALREVSGVAVVQTGGMGNITSLFMRGGESDYTKVLIDGIPVNDPGGSYNFSNLSTSNIERIEVVRGPQSALFGSDAMSGVIQVFTKKGTSEGLSPKTSAVIEGGNYSTFRYGGSLEGSNDRMDYMVSFSRLDTDNNAPNDSFNEATVAGNLGLHLSRKTELRAVFRSEAGRSGVPGATAFGRPDLDAYYRRRDESGSLTLTDYRMPSWTQKLSYTIQDSRQFSDDPIDSGSFTPSFEGKTADYPSWDWVYQNLSEMRRQGISYQSDLVLPRGHLFSAGGDYERESGISGDPISDAPLPRLLRNNYGAYFQDQWSATNRFFATAGVRLDQNQSFGFFASPRVSIAFLAHQAGTDSALGITKIKANFGMGIKEPTLIESYGKSRYYVGNPHLRPEKSVSFDVGIEQVFNSGKGALELTYFQNRFRDQIGFVLADPTTYLYSYFNIGKSRARGLESTLRYDIFSKLQFSGNYTFLDSEILDTASKDPVFEQGQELFRRPRHSGYVDLLWKPGRVSLGATALMVGTRVDSDFSGLGLKKNRGYATLNFLASLRLIGGMSVFGTVNNALDKQYMEVLGYPALGRNFRIGLRAGF